MCNRGEEPEWQKKQEPKCKECSTTHKSDTPTSGAECESSEDRREEEPAACPESVRMAGVAAIWRVARRPHDRAQEQPGAADQKGSDTIAEGHAALIGPEIVRR
jgi:hypothetical protein